MVRWDLAKEAKETDEALSKELEKLSGLTNSEIAALLLDSSDHKQLKSLIKAINKETELNKKKAVLLDRLATASGVVKGVVERFVRVAV